ncbi:uncharacterized protein TRIADDRAFT_52598 [Trichoplax adhaerens]|uniref:G-protein coupled receptors family 1 profile domain-containing protein n=1 Tax=Trichoplax adhaerens TaxID=10228 RepID=B3RJE7_TRIAD|nr:hypothetical protein TRIADDRAFT_52598 [Trichoplax adhaerens]EDV29079.1 hypothetical protein TRIADDRAFT_52598 [Trichoplax adhaerens]|eukprot:XP_002108281.1 hypothetical protein TRIADDRAFT_52598 [Trichoplax adhaerens]
MNFSSVTPTPAIHLQVPLIIHIMYGILSNIAIIGNLLVLIVSIHSRSVIKGPLHTLIFCLAIMDMMTGIVAFITPGFAFAYDTFPYPNGTAGLLYCRLIDSEYFFFSFGFVSIYIVLLISLERWCAIAKPWRYQIVFSVKNCRITVLIIVVLQLSLTLENTLNMNHKSGNIPPCIWGSIFADALARNVFFIVMETIRLFIPVCIIVLCYLDIARRLLSRAKIGHTENTIKAAARRRATVMAFSASIMLIICWLPNELYFTLYQFKVIDLDEILHKTFKILIIFNSSINPFVYASTNELYRNGLFKLFAYSRWRCYSSSKA